MEPAAPRATSQVMPPRPAPQQAPAAGSAEDLFPEHQRDDQFEIPAFLRRQTN